MKNCVAVMTILIVYGGCILFPTSVFADITPPPPPSGSNILPGETTQVRMMAETVIMTVQPSGVIVVDASFTMHNTKSTEERMDVYFPLKFSPDGYELPTVSTQCIPDGRKSVDDLSAWVNGVKKTVLTKYTEYKFSDEHGDTITRNTPCWAVFAVVFPPDKDVSIRVTYTSANPDYVLQTGERWKDTIGSADIIVRFPYEITPLNFFGCHAVFRGDQKLNCQLSTNEARWHGENFEPDFDFSFDYRSPRLWNKVLEEIKLTEKHPLDAEGWGRLGRAYKDLIINIYADNIDDTRIIYDKQGEAHVFPFLQGNDTSDTNEVFQLSSIAYQKAIELKPKDAGWHYGYAELLCLRASTANLNSDEYFRYALPCVQHLKFTLENQPSSYHEDALLMMKFIGDELVDLSGPQPDYLILTPPAATQTRTPTLTVVPSTETATFIPTQTSTKLPTQTPIYTSTNPVRSEIITPAVQGVHTTAQNTGDARWAIGITLTILCVGFGVAILFIGRQSKSSHHETKS